jgi:hypothetical protein
MQSVVPEIVYGIGAAILLAALIWGTWQYRSRNRANDQVTEKATRDLYRDPDHYNKRDEEKHLRPS